MIRKHISSGSSFENEIGYSRAVGQGDWIFVSGTTGYDYDSMIISDNIVEQAIQCFENIKKALESADASLQDVVRVLYIVPDASEFEKCWPVLRQYLGDVKPAATMISCGLANKEMKIEIEVTCLRK